jgi:predicted GIY-YIG superfamily endonuclease
MKGYTYILQCSDGSYYVGSTNNLELRLAQHQAGEGANHTKKRLPVELVYYEEYSRIDEAFYREKQIQGWRRGKKEALIKGAYDKLPELARAYGTMLPSTNSGNGGSGDGVTLPSASSGSGGSGGGVTLPSTGSGSGGSDDGVTLPSTGSGSECGGGESVIGSARWLSLSKPPLSISIKESLGNISLLTIPKTAFLCSRNISASAVLKCYDWAIAQREAGRCIISGFHSQIEKDVLHYLLKGSQPIIVAMARGLKKKTEPEFLQPLHENRLLIITPFNINTRRISKRTANIRNKLMVQLADTVTVGYISPGGNLEKLLQTTGKEIVRIG